MGGLCETWTGGSSFKYLTGRGGSSNEAHEEWEGKFTNCCCYWKVKGRGECCLKLLAKVFNEVLSENKWLGDWILTSLMPIFKGKGIWTQLLDNRLMEIVNIVWKGTVDAVFVLRRFTKKFRSKGKKLFYVLVDLEKTFNLVPQKVTWWVLKIKGDPENLVHGIMSLYNDCKTAVSVDGELSESFVVQVGVYQRSVLSPLLFIVTDLLT